jgi:hypothetical protein
MQHNGTEEIEMSDSGAWHGILQSEQEAIDRKKAGTKTVTTEHANDGRAPDRASEMDGQ